MDVVQTDLSRDDQMILPRLPHAPKRKATSNTHMAGSLTSLRRPVISAMPPVETAGNLVSLHHLLFCKLSKWSYLEREC